MTIEYDEQEFEHILATALNRQLTRDEIDDAIAKFAGRAIEEAIASEIQIFYLIGDGREIIKNAVLTRLNLHGNES